ncbi:ElaA protein [Quadrisphaera granulorum]|uniref:ElaA protein n=1 Tax=Quadrisphaera granulorum TaxID=317664 RepID=A0A316A913_9ACTN|nr:GNAT family N-acetyltransferase [Quadrisphaera granulorum]PWJ53480.1 ElaA protein [Quadrisphaera granulorum]SZE96822.1 ElaA protein [Quadrisphaera granulorum]
MSDAAASHPTVHRATWGELDPALAYAVLKLRVDVFVVEQECPYPELDGRDLEATTEHLWVAGPAGTPVGAYLRVLAGRPGDPDGARRIGRVVTSPAERGHGLAGVLLDDVVTRHGDGPLVLDAQAPLERWYTRWGFEVSGPAYVEDGIPHVPMTRLPRP